VKTETNTNETKTPEKKKAAEPAAKVEEPKKQPAKKKKVGGKLGDIMAKLNQQKGGNDIGKAPSPRKPRKKINPNLMQNIPMPGSKPPAKGGAKKVGKVNANFMKGKGIPMPGMGVPPSLRKKKPADPTKMDEVSNVTAEKATIQTKRKKRRRKKVNFSDL